MREKGPTNPAESYILLWIICTELRNELGIPYVKLYQKLGMQFLKIAKREFKIDPSSIKDRVCCYGVFAFASRF